MTNTASANNDLSTNDLSIAHGIPLDKETGIGALTIAGYLREVAARYTDAEALAIHGEFGVERWTYQDLLQRSLEVAQALVAQGVMKDTRIGLLMSNRPEFLAAFFGIAMAGGVAVVFSTFSTAAELSQLLKLSRASLLLFEGSVAKKDFCELLLELEPNIAERGAADLQSVEFPFLKQVIRFEAQQSASETTHAGFIDWQDFLHGGESISAELVLARAEQVDECDAAGLFFSSGTTGVPKGILHAQRAFTLQWWRMPTLLQIEGPQRCWTGSGFFWSGNIAMTVGLTLSAGGCLVLQPYFEAQQAVQLLQDEKVSYMYGRPHQWARLLEAPNWQKAQLQSLRYITRGETLWAHPTVNTDWVIPMGYGNTETMSISTSNVFNLAAENAPNSFGTPLPGNTLKVIDPLTEEVVPVGQRGELCIKGPTLMLGYLGKNPESTFDKDGYLRTGDGGYIDELGCLFWEGRLNEIIKTGGVNVSPVEIDEAIALFPGVKRAQTMGIADDALGERIVSCVVPHDGVTLSEVELRSFLKERLASYKIPKQVLFVAAEDIAVTGSGKVKLEELRARVTGLLAAHS